MKLFSQLRAGDVRQIHLTPVVIALSLVMTLSACHKPEPVAAAPREVVVLPAQAASGAHLLRLPAEVQPRFVTAMSLRVAGQLIERRVHLGDRVRKGQVVARLDPADAEHNAASANAELASARQHLDAADKQLARDVAQAREQLISPQQLEQSQDAQAAAQAQFKAAQARAAVAGNQRGYTNLVAEHDGVISAEQANTGDVLAAGQSVFSLSWSGATDVTADIGQAQLGGIRAGAPATLSLTALPGQHFSGRVRELSPAADPQSRTYRVKVTLDQPGDTVRQGMSGEVAIERGAQQADAMLLPATALFHQGDKPAVWIVKPDGQLELRPVTVSGYGERSITLSQGVQAGENVVVQGVHTLTVGDKVKPVAPLHAEDFAL